MKYTNYSRNGLSFGRRVVPGNYVTSAVCNVLGYTKQCFIWQEIEELENKILETDENMIWSSAYDSAEPLVAKKIVEEYETTHDRNTWMQIYNIFLSDIAILIGDKMYVEALDNYQKMMNALKKYFGIDDKQSINMWSEEYGISNVKVPVKKLVIEK